MGADLTRRQFIELTAAAVLSQNVHSAAQGVMDQLPPFRLTPHLASTGPSIHEPYAFLHGGRFDGPPIPESPDPLVQFRWDNPRAGDDLQIYVLNPAATFTEKPAAFRVNQTSPGQPAIEVRGVGSIRFDFGVESPAWLEFDSPDLAGVVEMSISEYDEPAVENVGPKHRIKTAPPMRYGNTYRLELNSKLYEGVRFGWIHVRTFEHPWHITAVRAVCQVKPTNYCGDFACSEPMFTSIWYTGAYSVKANFCKNYFGALLMDRGDRISWTGDAHPAQAAALVAFGNWDFIRENLERSATTNNGIESYSLYWILSLLEYYQHTGDQAVLKMYMARAMEMLRHAESIYTDPPITFYGWDERLGAGFEQPNRSETKSAYRMLFIHTCIEFACALDNIGESHLSQTYQDMAFHKVKEVRSDRRWYQPFGVHALSDALNTSLLTEEEKSAIFAQEFSNRLERLSFSPFNQYFILQAMGRMNRYDEAMLSVRDVWGGQINYGGTMFFETYAPSWNQCLERNGAVPNCQAGYTSLGHAWGSGVTAWLSHEVLGIKPASPGFKTIEITPHLGQTLSWVSGSVPTPYGAVRFRFNQISGCGEVTVPLHTRCLIGIPNAGRGIRKIVWGDSQLWDGEFHKTATVGGVSLEANFLYLNDVEPGHYKFCVSYEKGLSRVEEEPLIYAIDAAREDRGTSGNWGGIYGKDGYVLFDYDGVNKDRRKLPSYVVSVAPASQKNGGCQHAQVAVATQDERAPAADQKNGRIRNIGQLYTGDPLACQQTMTVDVEVLENKQYSVGLYFVDWDRQERRQAVAVFDLHTLNRLAPVEMVRDFTQGKYLIYTCSQSVRFRIDQVRGKNAVLNAMFFDSAF